MVQSPLGNWYPNQEYRECEAIPSNLHWEILTRLLKPAEYYVLMVEIVISCILGYPHILIY